MSVDNGARTAVEVDHAPARLSSYVAVGAAVVAVLASAPFSVLALPFGLGGVAIFSGALFVGSRRWLGLGVAGILAGVIAAGVAEATTPELMLISVVASLVAWDVAQNAMDLGEQIGRGSRTRRAEVVHAAGTAMIATLSAGVAYGLFRVAGGGRPPAAVLLLVLGAVLVTWAIRGRD